MDESMPKKIDILLTGVGGQGVVLAGDIIGDVAVAAGYDVKKSDTLGMAQRGGGVVAHIRLGQDVASPLIPQGEVDYLIAFEKMEAARWAHFLKPEAIVIYNDQAIPPLSVSREEAAYPSDEQIMLTLTERTPDVFPVQASKLAEGLGNPKTLNILLLGAFSMFAPFSPEPWKKAVRERVPENLVDLNLRAFSMGRKEVMRVMTEIAAEQERLSMEEAREHRHDDGCGCGH
jgi:indolepyruvate ferredoxin oxidoreductase beta subunit